MNTLLQLISTRRKTVGLKSVVVTRFVLRLSAGRDEHRSDGGGDNDEPMIARILMSVSATLELNEHYSFVAHFD